MSARFLKLIILPVLFAAVLYTQPASAATTLTSDQVKNFTDAIPDIETFSAEMKKQGKDKALEAAVKPKKGDTEFTPYTKGVVALKTQFPDDYKTLGDVVAKHGFTSQENWSDVGDNVMQAYLANKMEGQNMEAIKAMAQMTPEMKAKLPAQAQAQLAQATAMMKLVQGASAENKAAVKPHIGEIDAWLQRESSKMKTLQTANGAVKPLAKPSTITTTTTSKTGAAAH